MTHNPFGSNFYTAWAKDSGWIEATVFINVRNGRIQARTRNGYVRWGSNNWFTNQFLAGFADYVIRDSTSEAINAAIVAELGGNSVSLSDVVAKHAVPILQRELNLSAGQAKELVTSAFRNVNVNSALDQRGIKFSIDLVPRHGVIAIKNPSNNPITYKIRFNEKSGWKKVKIAPRSTICHWSQNATRPNIEFDGSSKPGYQRQGYRLDVNWCKKIAKPVPADGRQYAFQWNNGGLSLRSAKY